MPRETYEKENRTSIHGLLTGIALTQKSTAGNSESKEIVIAERITAGGVSGASSELRCAFGIKGEYCVRCFRVRSLMFSRLEAS